MSSETISPTAHYTGYVWFANGFSHPAFATRTGRVLYQALRGPNLAAKALRLPTLDGLLLARHRLIDLRLSQAIDSGEVTQVIEVACGLSPRGWRFRQKYGDAITYVEADLPGMLANKREILARLGGESAHHRTAQIDALADSGPHSIAALCADLDPARGTAIITEGLVNYFDRDTDIAIWRRFAAALARFPRGLYFSDLVLADGQKTLFEAGFMRVLGVFVRGSVHVDFANAEDAERCLESAGFEPVLLDPRDFEFELPDLEHGGAGRVRIVEALSRPSEVGSR